MSRELNEQEWKDLLRAVRHNEVENVKELTKDVDVNSLSTHQYGGRGVTLLYEAVRLGNEEALDVLLEKGLDVNVPTKMGEKVLDSLWVPQVGSAPEAYAKRNRMMNRLLAAGAVDEKGYGSKTPLMQAIEARDLDKIKNLIKEGADLNAKDADGRFVWEYALMAKNKEIMEALIEGGMNLEQQNKNGKTPLMQALFNGDKDMALLLIEKGADVNAKSTLEATKDMTPLFFTKDKDLVEALVNAGADVNAKNAKGETAIFGKPIECLKIMHDAGADLNAKDSDGMSLMHDAALSNNIERIKFLQEQGLDINAKDDSGWTPLIYAVVDKYQAFEEQQIVKTEETSVEFIEQLLKLGAKVSITDEKGRTAVDLVDEKCDGLRELLKNSATKEKEDLKQYLGMQASVSHAIGDKKIKEAESYEAPKDNQKDLAKAPHVNAPKQKGGRD